MSNFSHWQYYHTLALTPSSLLIRGFVGGRHRQQRPIDSKKRTTMRTNECQVLRAREPASFSRENVITVVILLRLAKMS